MLTVGDLSAHLKHALGGPLLEDLDPLYLVNETGNRITSMRAWNWMIRPQVILSLVANQEYMTVPADFGEIVTIEFIAGLTARVLQSTFPTIAQYRSQAFASPGYLLYIAISHAPDPVTGVLTPRFEVYPTPSTNNLNSIKMFYRARWTDITGSDNVRIPVPPFMEPLFIQVFRAVALGYQKEDEASMSMRLRDVIGGPDWTFAARSDNSEQTNRGPLRGGALQTAWGYDDFEWLLQNQILPPTAT